MIPGLVSVIIPTYNRPDYLREAVDSVFAQTYPFIEILVIDDGSSAEGARTRSALKPYLSDDSSSSQQPKVTYLYQKNCGLVPAVNRGLGLAQGEYIQRLDDDDRLLTGEDCPFCSMCFKPIRRSDWLQRVTITSMRLENGSAPVRPAHARSPLGC